VDAIRSKVLRRWYFACISLAAILLVTLRLAVLPLFRSAPKPSLLDASSQLIDSLLAATLGSFVVSLLILWLIPSENLQSQLGVVEPARIRAVLEGAYKQEQFEWWYRGHAARYFRAVTLPRLAQDARSSGSSRRIYLQVLDPTSRAAQAYYFRYRESLRSNTRDPWTLERVAIEIYATIVSVLVWREEVSLLDVNIRLGTTVSPLTIDMSSTLVLVTQEGSAEPALRYEAGTAFYRAYREELRMSFDQARDLALPEQGVKLRDLTVPTTRKLIADLRLGSDTIRDSDIESIIQRVREPHDPYA
jgi:hypothetical protein